MKFLLLGLASALFGGSFAVHDNCSYGLIDLTPLLMDTCFDHYDATNDSSTSRTYQCVNESYVRFMEWSGTGCSGTADTEDVVPIALSDFSELHCGSNVGCSTVLFKEYSNNITDQDYCDIRTDSFEELGIVIEECFSNGTHSAWYGCYGGSPTRLLYETTNCTGDVVDVDRPGGCDCDENSNECRVTIIDDICEWEVDDSFDNCSYAVSDTFSALRLGVCYDGRNETGAGFSVFYNCVDKYTVSADVYTGHGCEDDPVYSNFTFSVFAQGWDYAVCGNDVDCDGRGIDVRIYEGEEYCDTRSDSYFTVSLLTGLCLNDGVYGAQFGCDGTAESQQVWITNLDCDGDPDFTGEPDGCNCDDDVCELAVVEEFCGEEDDPLPTCSYAQINDFTAIGLDLCYNNYEADTDSKYSVFISCVDEYNVNLEVFADVYDCEGSAVTSVNSSIFAFGWQSAKCASGTPDTEACVARFREYNSTDGQGYCDTSRDSFQELAVMKDLCLGNGSWSVTFGCSDGVGTSTGNEVQKLWFNANCSGEPDYMDEASEDCNCDDWGKCEITVIDACEVEDTLPTCSYAQINDFTAIGLDLCYNNYDADTDSKYSVFISCVDEYNVNLEVFSDVYDCDGTSSGSINASIFAFGWQSAKCASDTPDTEACVARFTEYNSTTGQGYCDTSRDSFQELAVMKDLCLTNGSWSVTFGCSDGEGTTTGNEVQKLWLNDDCSGDPFYMEEASEDCNCDDWGKCELTVIDACEDDDVPHEDCSYAVVDDGIGAIGLDLCYNRYFSSNDTFTSTYIGCIDKFNVNYMSYAERNCEGDPVVNVNISVFAAGWDYANCGSNTDCAATYKRYEGEGVDCDTETFSYEQGSIVFDACWSNGTHSAYYDCGSDGMTPTKSDYANTNCSGTPYSQDNDGNCECEGDSCSVLFIGSGVCGDPITTTMFGPGGPTDDATRVSGIVVANVLAIGIAMWKW